MRWREPTGVSTSPVSTAATDTNSRTRRIHPGVALFVLTILCLTLLLLRIRTFMGLPAHPFLIHIPVVFVPLCVIGVLVFV
jgi:hypothetical protein